MKKTATLIKPTEGHYARRRNELYATKHEKCNFANTSITSIGGVVGGLHFIAIFFLKNSRWNS